ncbi:hypothetical protein [Alkaliphilus serpentinus]|uniref:Small, acid-soluble spore protein, alpha/beta type n=1 Tax=Alkaliphilus serpentinus TaxID=1482731 RepID=A0A833HNY6_9FIRM|nr:hypothetical protein [Alkaliphilus serpentinus]KAB3530187.1 hypothetical protein F8153_07730 [Alkaliphilus serpentinus]
MTGNNNINLDNGLQSKTYPEGNQRINGRLLVDSNPNVDFGNEASRQMSQVGGRIGGKMTKGLVEMGLKQMLEERNRE